MRRGGGEVRNINNKTTKHKQQHTHLSLGGRHVLGTLGLPAEDTLRAVPSDELDRVEPFALGRHEDGRVDTGPGATFRDHRGGLLRPRMVRLPSGDRPTPQEGATKGVPVCVCGGVLGGFCFEGEGEGWCFFFFGASAQRRSANPRTPGHVDHHGWIIPQSRRRREFQPFGASVSQWRVDIFRAQGENRAENEISLEWLHLGRRARNV